MIKLKNRLVTPFRGGGGKKKSADYLHRTAQPPVLAAFRPWGGSAGAGRARPAGRKCRDYHFINLKIWKESSFKLMVNVRQCH